MPDERIGILAANTARQYGRDPFRVSREKGITVLFRDDFTAQKGAFTTVSGQMFIFINSRLSDEMQRLVCAHELGHALLHRNIRGAFLEFALFDTADHLEYEANLFAADFLLSDEDVRTLALEGADALSMARNLNTNVNLLLLKLSQMNLRGAGFHLPRLVRADFLKNVTDDSGVL